jgi:hypothetical protein
MMFPYFTYQCDARMHLHGVDILGVKSMVLLIIWSICYQIVPLLASQQLQKQHDQVWPRKINL